MRLPVWIYLMAQIAFSFQGSNPGACPEASGMGSAQGSRGSGAAQRFSRFASQPRLHYCFDATHASKRSLTGHAYHVIMIDFVGARVWHRVCFPVLRWQGWRGFET